VARLRKNSKRFFETARGLGLDLGSSEGHAVIPVVVHSSISAVSLSQRLFERGINVQPIIHPAVPERSARLRFFLTSEHSEAQIDQTCAAIAEEVEKIGDGKSISMAGQVSSSGF
jgi:7-keto-8-aminopelargonate synthetase-like enzyme